MQASNRMLEVERDLVQPFFEGKSSYLEYMVKIIERSGKSGVKLPAVVKKAFVRIQRAARSARSAVRQTFAARKAAKSADGGGGSSDPDGRPRQLVTPLATVLIAALAFLLGGAK